MKASCPERVRLTRYLVVALTACALALTGCPDDEPAAKDAGSPPDTGADVVAPDVVDEVDAGSPDVEEPFVLESTCTNCHDVDGLVAGDPASAAPRAWMAVHGEGLLRYDPTAPLDARTRFELLWVRRGYHAGTLLDTCKICHPVYAEGIGHAVVQYGGAGRVNGHATGGTGCASGCHVWQGADDLTADGFHAGAPSVTVSSRPQAQLEAVAGGHATVWRDGFVTDVPRSDLKVWVVRPGCAGCHNIGHEEHGEIGGCLHCHEFGGESGTLHDAHETLIDENKATNDPDHADRESCIYCHNRNDPDAATQDEVYRAACYNCHLSGHQPMDADGQPHFWPVP